MRLAPLEESAEYAGLFSCARSMYRVGARLSERRGCDD